jgi:hypothetical protein
MPTKYTLDAVNIYMYELLTLVPYGNLKHATLC